MRPIIAIPTLNEAAHIAEVIAQLSTALEDGQPPEIWVLDGGSSDGTREIVTALGLAHVWLIENPGRTQAHALNLAASRAAARGEAELLIRADAHAGYGADYVAAIRDALVASGADSVVVPLRTVGGTRVQDAAAILFSSWLGTGGSPHRGATRAGPVEHGHHAGFRLSAFIEAGGYDTGFRANEDAEFDRRLTARGGRIQMEPRATVDYSPRRSFGATFRQYARNGTGRIMTAVKHRTGLKPRQLLPALLLPILVAAGALSLLAGWAFALLPMGYLLAVLGASARLAWRVDRRDLVLVVFGLALMAHLGFSLGATGELLRAAVRPAHRRWLRMDGDRLIPAPCASEAAQQCPRR
ncbi:MAG: glycosyltransferase family 2 protein [Pseudomonadota bacterium]